MLLCGCFIVYFYMANNVFHRLVIKLSKISPQQYVNTLLVLIGLAADLISLGLFVGVLHTPTSGSNFYVNSREFLAWTLIAIIYSFGFVNAVVRRRWRKLYGDDRADHSILNFFAWMDSTTFNSQREKRQLKIRNFQRDFSFLYVVMFLVTFLFSRAITATENATGLTSSPWGDIALSALIAVPVTLGMMIITSMFDFAMSMFKGD